jgi:hypothetical protein
MMGMVMMGWGLDRVGGRWSSICSRCNVIEGTGGGRSGHEGLGEERGSEVYNNVLMGAQLAVGIPGERTGSRR